MAQKLIVDCTGFTKVIVVTSPDLLRRRVCTEGLPTSTLSQVVSRQATCLC